jgi:prepilin-type N-terminal cleavage/methylation domain-containing protein
MNLTANRKNIFGFTLIELLVVISIIGILAAMVTVSFTSSQKQARDAKRKSDLKFYQSALEVDANEYDGSYIALPGSSYVASTTLCSSLSLTNCPEDPKNSVDSSTYVYHYQSDGVTTGTHTATSYALWAKLEHTTGYSVVCSTGSVITTTSQPSLSTCQ